MNTNNKKILDRYTKNLSSKGKNRNLYIRYAGDFLEYADGNFDRDTIDKYIEHLKMKHKYSDGSLNFAFRIIRTLFSRNNIEWPFARGEAPQIREDEIEAPALDPSVIADMIAAVKMDGQPDEKAFLAISTIYGTRKIEMVELTQEDVNLKGKTIHIATAKHGRERTHLIPEEIVPYLECYDFTNRISEFGLFSLWYRLEYRIGLTHTNQVGFHSIRRTINTILLDYLPETVVMSFLRWKQRTSSHMPYRYSAQRFVGREGVATKVIGAAKDVDQKVFDVHPFLNYWE
ncbi:site-specific integrase [Patescibacteria group bacterium]|nr:site-specific integrase [Patescibacteria group bacterium]